MLGNPAITAHLLEWLRLSTVESSCGVGKFWPSGRQLQQVIQFSTDEVYGPAPPGVMSKEWDPILPSNPYSASKAAQEADRDRVLADVRAAGLDRERDERVWSPAAPGEVHADDDPGDRGWGAGDAARPCRRHRAGGRSHTKAYAIVADGSGSWWEPSTRVWITPTSRIGALALLDERPALYADGIPRPDRYHVAGPEEVDVHTLCQWIGVALNKQPNVEVGRLSLDSSRPRSPLRSRRYQDPRDPRLADEALYLRVGA